MDKNFDFTTMELLMQRLESEDDPELKNIINDLIMVSSRTYYSDASQRASNEKGGIHVYKLNSGTDTFEAFNPATLNPTDKSTYGYDNAVKWTPIIVIITSIIITVCRFISRI